MAVGGGERELGLAGPREPVPASEAHAVLDLGGGAAPADAIRWDGSQRGPWPPADALFELPAPLADAPILVAGGPRRGREEVLETLRLTGVHVSEEELLTRVGLESACAVVLLAEADGEPTLPVEALCVLAARRVLIARRVEPTFGLMPGIDHVAFTLSSEIAEPIAAGVSNPRMFEPMRSWGALAARRMRASVVYARLETDLRLGLLAPS